MEDLRQIKAYLAEQNVDAWILVDYENRNPAVVRLLGEKMLTRKLFVVIPKEGKPYIICHTIDSVFLRDSETTERFTLHLYKTWQEMLGLEKELFSAYRKVAMDISENGLLPRVSLADYGSVDFVRRLGLEIVSSGDILQALSARLDEENKRLQTIANEKNLKIKDEAFAKISSDIIERGESDEYEIQQFICRRYQEEGMVYDDPPIVAIGPNASDPHYGPTAEIHSPIRRGDLVLIDMWAMLDNPKGVYSDITWMGYVGEEVPEVYANRFAVLKKDIDLCVEFLERELPKRKVCGYEVDDVSRRYIEEQGYGKWYVHRVGHSIAEDVGPHGCGANMDNYETHDEREILDDLCFSLEPGIYAPDFGMRSETNVRVDKRKPTVVAGRQEEIIPILLKR